ncbi:MAG: hypothetical protein BWY20_01663 [Spirochaetes bacterium ADurb.Bin215]|nr:MAG: hypothetical protein BWY20_01663 [Spirochaetes bacterium ADurb.Bin215]
MRGEILELFAEIDHVSEKAPRRIAGETERARLFRVASADGTKEQPLFIRFSSLFKIQQDVLGRRNVRKKRKGRRAVRTVPVAPVEAEIFPLKAFLGVFLPVPVDEKTGAAGNLEIVRNGSGFFKCKRKEEFLPFHGFIHPHVINEVFRAVGKLGECFKALLQRIDTVFRPQHFPRGMKRNRFCRAHRTLVFRIKEFDGFDSVKIKHDAVGHVSARHEDVEHLASKGKLAVHGNPRHPEIPLPHEIFRKRGRIKTFAHRKRRQQRRKVFRRRHRRTERPLGHDKNGCAACGGCTARAGFAARPRKHGEARRPLTEDRGAGRDRPVRHGSPPGENFPVNPGKVKISRERVNFLFRRYNNDQLAGKGFQIFREEKREKAAVNAVEFPGPCIVFQILNNTGHTVPPVYAVFEVCNAHVGGDFTTNDGT